jgi:hypothetical protein
VELLVVMLMVMVLVGILLPVIEGVKRRVQINNSFTMMGSIIGGIKMYRSDTGVYPPSGPNANVVVGGVTVANAAVPTGFSGGAWLVECLTGYMPASSIYVCDYRDGFGWKYNSNASPVYGPYNGLETARLTWHEYQADTATVANPMFADSFGNAFQYARFDNRIPTGTGNLLGSHYWVLNTPTAADAALKGYTPTNAAPANTQGGVDTYAAITTATGYVNPTKYYRYDFVLASPGPNGVFDDPATAKCDDINNLTGN